MSRIYKANRPEIILVDDRLHKYVHSRPLSLDPRNRIRIHLHKHHINANSGGWQYLSRFVVEYLTGEKLKQDEHVHHENGILHDCRSSNLSVYLAEYHGRHHANYQLLYMLRDRITGRFMKSEVPRFSEQIHNCHADSLTNLDEVLF